jgi:N-acetylmuramoyl-L-alanine amidase
MATYHTVQQGECLSSIAYDYKLPHWRTIYDHPENGAFKAKRPDPNLIYPGDVLYIPNSEEKEEGHPTDQRHIFVVEIPPTYINIRIQDFEKKPIRNAPYELDMDAVQVTGNTDGEGWIRHRIPAWAELGVLKVYPCTENAETVVSWNVRLGHLDPLDTTSGVKGRLNNLGYYSGEIDDVEDEVYDAAVREFQEDHGLVVDGIVGPNTKGKLNEEHRV